MGSGVSALPNGAEVELSKEEIRDLYQHVSQEYERKLTQLMAPRLSKNLQSHEGEAKVPTPSATPRQTTGMDYDVDYEDTSLDEEVVMESASESEADAASLRLSKSSSSAASSSPSQRSSAISPSGSQSSSSSNLDASADSLPATASRKSCPATFGARHNSANDHATDEEGNPDEDHAADEEGNPEENHAADEKGSPDEDHAGGTEEASDEPDSQAVGIPDAVADEQAPSTEQHLSEDAGDLEAIVENSARSSQVTEGTEPTPRPSRKFEDLGSKPATASRRKVSRTFKVRKDNEKKLYRGKDVQRKLVELILDDQPNLLHMKVKVNPKVLNLLGDEQLDAKSREHVNRSQVTPKVLARLGAACMIPEKALKRLGDAELTKDQRVAMSKSEALEAKERAKKRIEQLDRILKSKPTSEQTHNIAACKVKGKAFSMLGGDQEEELAEQVRKQVTADMTINKKTIQMTGATEILPAKIRHRRGSEMKDEQRKLMLKHEEDEKKRKEDDNKREMRRVLRSQPTEAQLQVPDEAKKKAKKLVQLAGASDIMPDRARKLLGDEMTSEQRKKMLEAEGVL